MVKRWIYARDDQKQVWIEVPELVSGKGGNKLA